MRDRKSFMKERSLLRVAGVLLVCLLGVVTAKAQQTTGVLCSTSATTTIDGKYVPAPPPAFGGVINLGAEQPKPCWPAKVVPPKGAPNVLLIMTDDQGYGVSGTFGGIVPTPAINVEFRECENVARLRR